MPRYTIRNQSDDSTFIVEMKYAELEAYLESNPDHRQVIDRFPAMIAGRGSIVSKISNTGNDALLRIKENFPSGNTIETK